MSTLKTQERVMFSTSKGAVKVGVILSCKRRLIQDEYEDIYVIETEEGKIYHVDELHIIQTLQ